MTAFRPLATGHHLLSLALAALVTTAVLGSLDAQADVQHAQLMAQQAQRALAAAAPAQPAAQTALHPAARS